MSKLWSAGPYSPEFNQQTATRLFQYNLKVKTINSIQCFVTQHHQHSGNFGRIILLNFIN